MPVVESPTAVAVMSSPCAVPNTEISAADAARMGVTGTVDHKKQQGALAVTTTTATTATTATTTSSGAAAAENGHSGKKGASSCKAPWTQEEDEEVRKLVVKHGDKSWVLVASYLPNRTGRLNPDFWALPSYILQLLLYAMNHARYI
jgi:hypothetical protein